MAHSRLYFLTSVTVKPVHTYVYPPSEIIMKFCTAVLTSGTVEGIHRSGSTFGLGLTNTERNLKKRKTNIMQTNWRTEKHKESDTPQHRPKEVVYIETFKRQDERQFYNQLCEKEKKKTNNPNQTTTTTTTVGITLGRGQNCFSSAHQNNAVIHSRKVKTLYPVLLIRLPPHPTQPHPSFFFRPNFFPNFFPNIGRQKATFLKKKKAETT